MNENLYPKSCPLCGDVRYQTIFTYAEPDRYEVTVGVGNDGYSREWVKCKNCGSYYSIYSRGKGVIERIYTSDYRAKNAEWRSGAPEEVFYKVMALPEGQSETKFRVKWIKDRIKCLWENQVVQKDNPPYNFLDIGGGTGVFAFDFQDGDWRAHVMDPNEDAIFIKNKLNIPLVQEYYSPKKFSNLFHLVSMVFVLEHLSDPVGILKNLRADMTTNSFLYIEVPDAIAFERKPKQDDIFNSCHLWMFSPSSLAAMLSRGGFELLTLDRVKIKRGHYAIMAIATPASL